MSRGSEKGQDGRDPRREISRSSDVSTQGVVLPCGLVVLVPPVPPVPLDPRCDEDCVVFLLIFVVRCVNGRDRKEAEPQKHRKGTHLLALLSSFDLNDNEQTA